ncbi:hypothetical protein COLO4_21169 [Corchorus olitorius]|uniref:Hydroxyproline-rich glycoprotein family protein n=1 Tax=Corchorus olitorius TaxID=93759 RepID=A0A1R3IV11_9ROSI|nr:hypothetical protein COLO4_21169 [Corchorus olitorius]
MKGRSSKQETKQGMEIDKISKIKEEPQLSGAYIRSLVKQLTSSRTKDNNTMNPKDNNNNPDDSVEAEGFNSQNLTKFSDGFSETATETQQQQQTQPPQQQHKKQVRRRLHTSRPYQERLLNMAEARREIVTALKFHRAAMKQATEQQQQQPPQEQELQQFSQPSSYHHHHNFEQESKTKSRRNPRIYPSNTNTLSPYNLDNFSYSSFSQQHYPPPPSVLPPNPYSWPASSQIPLPSVTDSLNFNLPNQTLGLNLNFHDFNNIDTTLYHNNNNNPSIYSSSSPSSSSSPTLSVVTEEIPSGAISHHEVGPTAVADLTESDGGGGLHQAMDDEEMAEIRSLGEQHQMEWNDKMNLVTSAWWFKFLKTMELGPEVKAEDDDGFQPFDPVMEFPSWLNANEHFNDHCPDDYFQDPALPCMDIGEIEGMDGDWLS